jgi:peroxiredoxin
LVLLAPGAHAGKFNEVLSAGDPAPDFSGLAGTDGMPHGLADYAGARLVVLVFTSNRCPVARAYGERLNAIQQERAGDVQVVAVNVGRGAAETLEKMKARADEAALAFPYLRDAELSVARAYGVTATPQVFLLAPDRTIAYMGRIDDATDAGQVTRPYLARAIEALLAGQRPETVETRPVGCAVDPR